MNKTTFLVFIWILLASVGCSSVKLAVFGSQKRYNYALENRAAFVNSPTYKTKTLKEAFPEAASRYIGTRYKYGSCDPKSGFDCSGLVYTVAKSQHLDLPRSSGLMAASGPHISWKKANIGDLVFFGDHNKVNHVGIIERKKGNQLWVIHSTSTSGVIEENVLASSYWKKKILFAVEIIPAKS